MGLLFLIYSAFCFFNCASSTLDLFVIFLLCVLSCTSVSFIKSFFNLFFLLLLQLTFFRSFFVFNDICTPSIFIIYNIQHSRSLCFIYEQLLKVSFSSIYDDELESSQAEMLSHCLVVCSIQFLSFPGSVQEEQTSVSPAPFAARPAHSPSPVFCLLLQLHIVPWGSRTGFEDPCMQSAWPVYCHQRWRSCRRSPSVCLGPLPS